MAEIRENSGKEYKVGKGRPPLNTRFKKGQSGNPMGGPRKLPALDKLMAEVLGKEDGKGKTEAQKILEAVIKRAMKGDVKAAEMLLNRGYGLPKQTLNIESAPIPIMTVDPLNGDKSEEQKQ